MKRNTKRTCKAENETEKILTCAARQSNVPHRHISTLVKESMEHYENAVKTANDGFATFEFRNLK